MKEGRSQERVFKVYEKIRVKDPRMNTSWTNGDKWFTVVKADKNVIHVLGHLE